VDPPKEKYQNGKNKSTKIDKLKHENMKQYQTNQMSLSRNICQKPDFGPI
jgi:hypothetical protein